MVKEAILKMADSKHYQRNMKFATLHNKVYAFCPTMGVLTGTTNSTRIGDSIYLAAIKVHFGLASASGAGSYSYRMIVGYSTIQATTPLIDFDFVETTQLGGIFLTVNNNNQTGIFNPKAFTVLDDRIVDLNSNIAGVRDGHTVGYTVSLKQNFNYIGPTSAYGKLKQLYVLLCPNIMDGVNGVNPCGEQWANVDLIFKDL